MKKMPVISGYAAIKALRRAGFVAVRQKGSHVRLKKIVGDKIIKLTVPLHETLKKGTLKRIIKDANLEMNEFVKLL